MPARFSRLVAVALVAAAAAVVLPPTAAGPVPAQAQQTATVTYHAGWNLVAGPSGTTLSGVHGDLWTLAPDGSGYESVSPAEPLSTGAGYWALFLADTRVSLPATPAQPLQLSLPAGAWTIAGNPFSEPAALSGSDIVYGFDPTTGYTPLTVLPPGRAALVYSAAGDPLALAPAGGGPDTIAAPASTAPTTAAASAAATPTAPATAAGAGSVIVVASGVGQTKPGGPVTVAALIRNDGPNVDGTPVTITVYDTGGNVLAAGSTTLHYLPSGASSGFAHRLTAHGSGTAATAQIEMGQGRPAGDPQPGAISFSQIAVNGERSGLRASAILSSTYAADLSEVRVDAIAYDNRGAIVGGGETVDRLVPAGSATGVIVSLDLSTTPTRVELYATLP